MACYKKEAAAHRVKATHGHNFSLYLVNWSKQPRFDVEHLRLWKWETQEPSTSLTCPSSHDLNWLFCFFPRLELTEARKSKGHHESKFHVQLWSKVHLCIKLHCSKLPYSEKHVSSWEYSALSPFLLDSWHVLIFFIRRHCWCPWFSLSVSYNVFLVYLPISFEKYSTYLRYLTI